MEMLTIKTNDGSLLEYEIVEQLDPYWTITKYPEGGYNLTHRPTTYSVSRYVLSIHECRELHSRLAHLDWNFISLETRPLCFPEAVTIIKKFLDESEDDRL